MLQYCEREIISLNFTSCKKLDNEALKMIAESPKCQQLAHLDLSFCRLFTNSGLLEIAKNCKSLKSLSLYGSCFTLYDINKKSAYDLANVIPYLGNLEELNIGDMAPSYYFKCFIVKFFATGKVE